MEDGFKEARILIAGLGLIGGSVAKALRRAGYANVCGFDSDLHTLNAAMAEQIINNGFTEVRDITEQDIIICCLPPGAGLRFCREAQWRLSNGGVFVETGGLKSGITDGMAAALCEGRELLSLHPMAGREKSGYANSDAELFRGSVLVLTPTAKTGIKALMLAGELSKALGCSDILELSAKRHDEVIARVSHLPHIVALAFKAMDRDEDLKRFAGGSYRSATRVADLNPALWAELFSRNKDNVSQSISLLIEQLTKLGQAVSQSGAEELESYLKQITEERGE